MKIDARQISGFLRDPGRCRFVLLFGEDEGLIRERARTLTQLIAGTLNDPFRVVELDRDGWGNIAGEVAAMSMIGGRRVVRVREVTDAALEAVRTALKTATGTRCWFLRRPAWAKVSLRTFVEAAADGAAIGLLSPKKAGRCRTRSGRCWRKAA
jgi:DNA polymerase-3 subunit delta